MKVARGVEAIVASDQPKPELAQTKRLILDAIKTNKVTGTGSCRVAS
jgi:hypothetical protein